MPWDLSILLSRGSATHGWWQSSSIEMRSHGWSWSIISTSERGSPLTTRAEASRLSESTFETSCSKSAPPKGGQPESISHSVAPSAHTSTVAASDERDETPSAA